MPPRYSETDARSAIAASHSYAEALRRLGMRPAGGNHGTLKRYATEIWRIPVDHFDPHVAQRMALRARHSPISLEQVLVEGSTYSRDLLKKRLYSSGLKARACEMCGQGEEWRGARMSLILDHVNGVGDDNRIENLRIVCPNCAATLDTHCGKNVGAIRSCARCGRPFRPGNRAQRHCSQRCGGRSEANQAVKLAARRVERPSYGQLLRELEETSYVAIGRRYGVSDNAIRKWLRAYETDGAQSGGDRTSRARDG